MMNVISVYEEVLLFYGHDHSPVTVCMDELLVDDS